jgi:O-antigen/teichoic acid export membrane protein
MSRSETPHSHRSLQDLAVLGAAWTIIDRWGNRCLSLVVFAVLGRLLEPEAFGLLAISLAVMDFLFIFAKQGLGQRLQVEKEVTQRMLSTAFWMSLLVASVLAAVMIAVAPLIGRAFGHDDLTPVIQCLALCMPINALGVVQTAVLRRELRFGVLSRRSLFAGVVGGVAGVIAAVAGAGVWSLAVQYATNSVVGAMVLWWMSSFRPSRQFDTQDAKRSWSFGSNVIGLELLTYATRNGDNLLIGAVLGPAVLGYYTIAYRVLQIVTELFTGVASSIVLPVFSKLQDDKAAMNRGILKASRITTATAMPIFVWIAVLASDLIPLLFGNRWDASVPILQALCAAGAINSAIYFSGNVLIANNRPRLALGTSALATALMLIAFAVAVQWGATAVALGFAVSSAIVWPIRLLAMRKVTGLSLKSYYAQWVRPAATTAISALVMLVAQQTIDILPVSVILGVLVHIATIAVLDRPFGREVRGMAASLSRRRNMQSV